MAVGFSNTNKPINPRAQDQSPKGYNRAKLYSGKALSFDGVNDQITTGQDLGNLQTLSVAMHCRIDNMTDGSGRSPISQWHGSDGWMIYKSGGGSELIFYRNSNNFAWSDSAKYSDQWIHLVYVIEQGVGAYVYANGKLVASDTTFTSDLDYTNSPTLKIGAYGNISGGFINGAINGVKIFNTALTAAQVADLYNNPEKVVPTGVDNTALKLWLPMMEGAGTTAYDGSGNGNHGTISGATYVNGVGAPVAQSAVMDWNKGVNYLNEYSEDFSDAGWVKTGSQILASSESNPYGKQTWEFGVVSLPTEVQVRANISFSTPASTAFKTIVIAKAGTLDWLRVRNLFVAGGSTEGNVWFNLSTGSVGTEQSSQTGTMTDLGDGWYKCEVSGTTAAAIPNFFLDIGFTDTDATNEPSATAGTGFLVLSSISLNGIYIETLGTAQTTPVLLPQGLTSGRDITGVNLFENVRKQGALNLDGNSWAEVHDNGSLDFGTGSFTLEAWVKADFLSQGSGANIILSLGGDITSSNNSGLTTSTTAFSFWIGGVNVSTPAYVSESWNHIVGVRSGSSVIFYFNGAQVATGSSSSSITNEQSKRIGRDTSIQRYYPNQIAQPRIYNRALTASEVLQNYNSGKNTYK